MAVTTVGQSSKERLLLEELRIEANGNLGPIDSSRVPRYAGAATYARLPRLDQVAKADVTVVGVPFDTGVSYRPGARFGANHIREASRLLRPYNPAWDVSPFENIQVADAGDMAVNPFNIDEAIETIQRNALDLTAAGGKLRDPRRRPHHRPAAAARRRRARRRAHCHAALRRAPGHLGHLLRRRVHPRHALPPRRRGRHPGHRGHQPHRHPRSALRQEGPRRRPPLRLRHRHLRRRLLPGRPGDGGQGPGPDRQPPALYLGGHRRP